MFKKELRVKLNNIEDLHPVSQGLQENILKSVGTMSFGTAKENNNSTKQTARKSTNTKYKMLLDASARIPSPCEADTKSFCSESSNLLSESHVDYSTMQSSSAEISTDSCGESSTDITCDSLEDSTLQTASLPVHKDNGINSLNRKVDPIKLKLKDILPTNTSPLAPLPSNNQTCKSKNESLKIKLKSNSSNETFDGQSNPPIKIFVSNINNCPIIQKSTKKLHSKSPPTVEDQNSTCSLETESTDSTIKHKNDTKNESSIIKSSSSTCNNVTQSCEAVDVYGEITKENHGKIVTSINSDTINNVKRPMDNDSIIHPEFKRSKMSSDDKDKVFSSTNLNINENGNDIKDLVNVKNEQYYLSWEQFKPEIEKFVSQCCQREIELQRKLDKKNEKYANLKLKYENLEDTFRSWIKFANDFQAKVRKIALHQHKQAEAVKLLKANSAVEKVSIAVQTEKVLEQKVSAIPRPILNDKIPRTFPLNKTVQTPKDTSPLSMRGNKSQVSPLRKVTDDVIDLTEETESSLSSSNNKHSSQIMPRLIAKSSLTPRLQNGTLTKNSSTQKSPMTGVSSLHGTSVGHFNNNVETNTLSSCDFRPGLSQQRILQYTPTKCGMINGNTPNSQQVLNRPVSMAGGTSHSNLASPYPPLPNPATPSYNSKIPRKALGPPPELILSIKKQQGSGGIVLSWNNRDPLAISAKVVGYELYAFHRSNVNEQREWRKIGDELIKAMDLPMACTLSQFSNTFVYFFAIRGMDVFGRFGPFSKPCSSRDVT